jgi:T5SS/PEP-CTERM-associated repeat protein
MGTTYQWIGGSDTYTNQNDWSPAGVPGEDDNATINVTGVIVTDAASNFIVGDVSTGSLLLGNYAQLQEQGNVLVGESVGASGTLTVSSSGRLVDQHGTAPDRIGDMAGATGIVSITGAGSAWLSSGRIFVGNGGSGTLDVAAGGLVTATGTGSLNNIAVIVAAGTASTGFLDVTGTGSSLLAGGYIDVGGQGAGTLDVLNGATVAVTAAPTATVESIFTGGGDGSSGTILVSGTGSVLNAGGGAIGIGGATTLTGASASGTLTVSAGGSLIAGNLNPGTISALAIAGSANGTASFLLTDAGSSATVDGNFVDGGSGHGSATIQGGATLSVGDPSRLTSDGIAVGGSASGVGSLLITGAGTKVTDTGRFGIGPQGIGLVTISGGAVVTSTGNTAEGGISMSLGATTTGQGYATVTGAGSQLELTSGLAIGGGATHSVGGSPTVTVGGSGYLSIASGGITSVAGGATIFAAGTVSLAGGAFQTDTLSLIGGIVTGAGTLSGAVSDAGTITASGGTLSVTGTVSGTGTIGIAAGSALSLTSGVSDPIAFNGAGGALILGSAASLSGAVSGFAIGDTIDLAGTPNAVVSFNAGTSTVGGALSAGSETLSLVGSFAGDYFDTYSDGHGGTDILLSSVPGGQSGTLPNVSGSFTSAVNGLIQSAIAALTPSGTTPSVASVSGGGYVPPSTVGALNALAVTGSGGPTTLPTGYAAGYLLTPNALLQDTVGGAALIGAAAGSTIEGAAKDQLFGGNAGATLVATAGAETLVGGTGANSFLLGSGTAQVTAQGTDTIVAGSGADTVNASGTALYFGAAGANDFAALAGTDTVIGGSGGNTVSGGSGNLVVFGNSTLNETGGSGAATILGGAGGNTVTGGSGKDLIFASSTLTYSGNSGAASIVGGSGPMNVNLGLGGGLVYGSPGGNDTLASGSGPATLVGGGAGDQLIATGSASDALAAGSGAETVNGSGSSGALAIFGGSGADVLTGGTGANLFIAGAGNETLTGGGTSDSYVFSNTPGAARTDVITNFNPNTDAIGLFGYGAEPGADAAALASATTTGSTTVVTLTDGTAIVFTGAPTLNSYNFF